MAVTLPEIYSFIGKFIQLSCFGVKSDGADVSVKMSANLVEIRHVQPYSPPTCSQSSNRGLKPSRIRRRKRRQAMRESHLESVPISEETGIEVNTADVPLNMTQINCNADLGSTHSNVSTQDNTTHNNANFMMTSPEPSMDTSADLQEPFTTAPDVLEFDPFAPSPPNQVHEEESTVGTALPSLELQSMMLALLQDINRRM